MMNKKKTAKKDAPPDDAADEPHVHPDLGAAEEPAEKRARKSTGSAANSAGKKGSGVIAWLALIVSFVAVAAFAIDFLRDRSLAGDALQRTDTMRALTTSIGATQEAITTLERKVSALDDLDAERNAQIESIGAEMDERLRQLQALPGRLASVEASMSSIQGSSTGTRDAWLLAEAEYYMQIANAQLQLANNSELARLALAQADDRMLQLADPRLTNVRQALSDEIRSLDAIAVPDLAGVTLTLASLAGDVDSLPLRQVVVVRQDQPVEVDPDLSGMDRAMASLKSAVAGIVSVRRADEAMQPLIAPEAQYFLRANLALQLQAARLALLRGEEGIFRQSLADVDSWLDEYYDPGSTAVRNARETIAKIRASLFSVAMPDISQSLRLLRRFNTMAKSEATDDAEPDQ